MAFLDDVHMVSQPERVGSVYAVLQEALFAHAGIRVHGGKTKVWNMAGVRPASCDVQTARNEDPRAVVWRGSGLVGHHDFITAFMERKSAEHATLLEHGSCCSTAHRPERTSCFEVFSHHCRPLLLQDTTTICGTVCVRFSTFLQSSAMQEPVTQLRCLWYWEAWG